MHGVLDVYCEITSLGGHIVDTFTRKPWFSTFPNTNFSIYQSHKSIYQETVPLQARPLQAESGAEGRVMRTATWDRRNKASWCRISVTTSLANSSLILADQIQPIPTSQVGTGPFVIGGTKVRPAASPTRLTSRSKARYLTCRCITSESTIKRTSLPWMVRYEDSEGRKAPDRSTGRRHQFKESFAAVYGGEDHGDSSQLPPGKYKVQISITDNIKKQSVSPSATF